MREQDKYSLWTLCKTLQYRKVFANAVVEETRIPCFSCGECQVTSKIPVVTPTEYLEMCK